MPRRTLLALMLGLPCAALAQVMPGNWELTVTSQLQGKQIGPLSQTRCFSDEDVRDPGRVLGTGASCQFSNRRESGDLYSFDVRCGGPIPMSGTGRIRQNPHAFEGDLDLAIDADASGGGGKTAISTRVTGRRLGPC